MEEAFAAFETAVTAFNSIQDAGLQLATLCMMFDHITEKNGLDKADTLDKIRAAVESVNSDMGAMY